MDIESFNVNNNVKEKTDFKKYDIDVSLNEVSSAENSCQLQYGYTFSSAPKGIRLSLEGKIDVNGNSSELESLYQKDEQNIPQILRMSYQELYPVLFMLTKSMKIPCPPYEISKTMDLSEQTEHSSELESISEDVKEQTEESTNEKEVTYSDEIKSADSEFDQMSTEELTKLQIDLSNQHSENPSDELKQKIDTINSVLNKKINESASS
ncbi:MULTISPECIES: hypothetical protein [Nitrosopumilus]|uniref:hypothetical protein n=1 Tax=Nitrosopumilus TaxID=338191 RepID=UPI0003802861|nr:MULTISPECIES: hypothetical protein [Nitrosopumilus]